MQLTADKVDVKDEITITDEPNLYSSDELIFPGGKLDGPRIRYGYTIDKMHFLVPEGVVSELVQKPEIFSLPNSPSWISGLINIRGNIIPVMNLDKYLKLNTRHNNSNILVFNKSDNDNALALVIDSLPTLVEHNDNRTETDDCPELLSDYIKPGFTQNNINWTEFDIQFLFRNLANNND